MKLTLHSIVGGGDWQTILESVGRSVRSATVKYLTMPTENQITLSNMLKSGSSKMKPTVDSIIEKYNIRPYNGSWYVTEKKLREVLAQIIEESFAEGQKDVFEASLKSIANSSDSDYC